MTFCKALHSTRLHPRNYGYLTIAGCISLLLHLVFLATFFIVMPEEKKPRTTQHNAIPVEIAVMPEEVQQDYAEVQPTAEEHPSPQPEPLTPREVTASDTDGKQDKVRQEIAIPEMKKAPAMVTSGKPARKAYAHISTVTAPSLTEGNAPTEADAEKAATAYTQKITLWFKNHKRYGALGDRQAMLRIHLNRNGTLVYSRIEVSTGDMALDQQIIDTAKFASPFPAFPPGYSSRQEEAFLLPINTVQE